MIRSIEGNQPLKRQAWPAMAVIALASCTDAGEPPESTTHSDRFDGRLDACEWGVGYQGPLLCGVLDVPEDRSVSGGRTIGLRVAVLPAIGPGEPAPDAVVFLAGGGVAPATDYLPFLARALRRLRAERDIVLVDQRGTGGSNALRCDLPEPHEVDDQRPPGAAFDSAYLAALRRCRATITATADPDRYTTSAAADDLEAVRDWLGYDRLSLWGTSYGTKVARLYMRRYGERVRAVVLHGVVPLEFSMWPDLLTTADSVLGSLFARCTENAACAAAYPDIEQRFTRLLARLERNPVALRVPVSGRPTDTTTVWLDRRALSRLTIGFLRSSRAARGLPKMLDELDRGDYTRLSRLQRPGSEPAVPRGVYLSITCAEEFPRLSDADLLRARAPTRFGAGEWLDEELRECEVWGAAPVPSGFWEPVVSDAPVLLLTGAEDFITPPGYAESVAHSLPNATLRELPQRSHDDIDPCVIAAIEEYLVQGRDTEPDLSCPEDRGPLPFDLQDGSE